MQYQVFPAFILPNLVLLKLSKQEKNGTQHNKKHYDNSERYAGENFRKK
jgi:hypothetical protein